MFDQAFLLNVWPLAIHSECNVPVILRVILHMSPRKIFELANIVTKCQKQHQYKFDSIRVPCRVFLVLRCTVQTKINYILEYTNT